MFIGPGTLHITDTVTSNDAKLTVTDGVLLIDGANQLQVGQLKFVDNTIESTEATTDIQIGLTTATADIIMNRRVKLKGGTFPLQTVKNRVMQGEHVSLSSPTSSGTVLFDIHFTEYPVIQLTPLDTNASQHAIIGVVTVTLSAGEYTEFSWVSSKNVAGVFWTAIGTVV